MPELSGAHRIRGLTLLELMIVLAIVGTLAAMALPSFVSMMERSRIETATDDLVAALRFARSEAIQQNVRVRLVGTDADGAPDVDANYADGWEVRLNGAAAPLRVYSEGFPQGVTCAACSGTVEFNGMGEAVAGSGLLRLEDGDEESCISLSRSGGVSEEC